MAACQESNANLGNPTQTHGLGIDVDRAFKPLLASSGREANVPTELRKAIEGCHAMIASTHMHGGRTGTVVHWNNKQIRVDIGHTMTTLFYPKHVLLLDCIANQYVHIPRSGVPFYDGSVQDEKMRRQRPRRIDDSNGNAAKKLKVAVQGEQPLSVQL